MVFVTDYDIFCSNLGNQHTSIIWYRLAASIVFLHPLCFVLRMIVLVGNRIFVVVTLKMVCFSSATNQSRLQPGYRSFSQEVFACLCFLLSCLYLFMGWTILVQTQAVRRLTIAIQFGGDSIREWMIWLPKPKHETWKSPKLIFKTINFGLRISFRGRNHPERYFRSTVFSQWLWQKLKVPTA